VSGRLVPSYELKIGRAREHVATVERAVDAWLETNDYTVVSAVDEDDPDRIVWSANVTTDPPASLSLLIGDAVHNLRSALDHVVYFLAETNLGTLAPAVEAELMFPIIGSVDRNGTPSDGQARFRGVAPKWLRGLSDNQVGLIESWQPYHWDDFRYHWLWVLHDLDRILTSTVVLPSPRRPLSCSISCRMTPNRRPSSSSTAAGT